MRKRISLMLSFVSLIAIVSTAIGVTRVYYTLFQTQVRNGLDQSAHILLESELFDTYSEENIRRLSELDFENLRITWIEGDGKVLFDNDNSADGLDNHRNRPEFKDAKQFGQAQSKRHSDTMDMDTFYYALLLDNGSVLRVSTQARNMTSVFVTALPIIFVIAV
ncbi:MAG: hypothetical protein K6G51_00305, partial [Sphaerochaetaceae bacterium]|nr:hypothetical protein [Sphaerochaetaceae bacterium]